MTKSSSVIYLTPSTSRLAYLSKISFKLPEFALQRKLNEDIVFILYLDRMRQYENRLTYIKNYDFPENFSSLIFK